MRAQRAAFPFTPAKEISEFEGGEYSPVPLIWHVEKPQAESFCRFLLCCGERQLMV